MKKLATLLLAAGLVFGAATGASAIDFKAKGQWIMSFDLGHGSQFMNKERTTDIVTGTAISGFGNRSANIGLDNFSAQQRLRLSLEAVASEFLSGTVQFEVGNTRWGNNNNNALGWGGALGSDGLSVEVKHAYIDWLVPDTDLKVRMGLQGLALPSFTTGGSMILADDAAAVVLSYKFNDNVSLAALWARPYNDNFLGNNNANLGTQARPGFNDNMDIFALLLPLSFDGVKVTPWIMASFTGPNTFRGGNDITAWNGRGTMGNAINRAATGMLPAAWSRNELVNDRMNQYGSAFWLGLTGEVTAWDPFRLAWDLNIGSAEYGKRYLSRGGWYFALLAEYKLDWGTPGLYGWYSSGDDSNPRNGSERMPTISSNGDNDFSWFAGNGNPYISREGVANSTMVGTWGIGARIKDMSFLEGLKHTFRVNYMQGTNSPSMARFIRGANPVGRLTTAIITDVNANVDMLYLTSRDSALEIGLTTTYKIYENLTLMVDMGYMALWLDNSSRVWGNNRGRYAGLAGGGGSNFSGTDAWNINASFVYQF